MGLTNLNDGKIHQDPQVIILPNGKAVSVFEEASTTESDIGFVSFHLVTKEIYEQKIVSDISINSYHPSLSYNSQE